ncbi:pyridoxamine 5'-phosphate oxidase family protein [Frankia sp. Cpl3]|uniref:pyridoxamine 5'-phosphate oxidase family protein n=1 Tax=Parafrankia colletiae TaxID=573497 RepID=UPI000A047138|nr:pyridoxamine 5'-phosphate oxidase family protein [Frankia sp. Cpl3]
MSTDVVPEHVVALLRSATIGHLATSRGSRPHVTPVWLDFDEHAGCVVVNLGAETRKIRDLRLNPHVAISLVSASNSAMWTVIEGTAVEMTADGGGRHLQRLARRYLGRDKRKFAERIVVRIKPERVMSWQE